VEPDGQANQHCCGMIEKPLSRNVRFLAHRTCEIFVIMRRVHAPEFDLESQKIRELAKGNFGVLHIFVTYLLDSAGTGNVCAYMHTHLIYLHLMQGLYSHLACSLRYKCISAAQHKHTHTLFVAIHTKQFYLTSW
jgi:hypothetical protein